VTPQEKIEIRSERGQTMAEFAIALPVLAVLLFGVIQFGIVFNNYVTLTDAARAGARKAAVSRHTDPAFEGCKTAQSSAGDLDLSDPGTCSVSVSGRLDRPGADVTVRVTYPYTIDLVGIDFVSGELESETTERME
jgi:Flp pilus assembly protein TadG